MSDHQHERLHAMDALRAVAMLLGIALHGGMAYMTSVWEMWAADDASGHWLFDVGFWTIHLFRMEVFFVMAGFFGCMLLARYGAFRFGTHRLKRIGLPLAISFATILPLNGIVWAWGLNVRIPEEFRMSSGQALDVFFLERPVSQFFSPGHLWFLEHLLVLYAVGVVMHLVITRVAPLSWAGERVTDVWAWCVRKGLAAPVFALLAFPTLFLNEGFGVGTQMGPFPPFNILLYYSVFFYGGWLLYRRRHDLEHLGRFWIAALTIGVSLVFLYLHLMQRVIDGEQVMTLLRATAAVTTASLVVGFTGLFLHLFRRPNRTMRYISDSAYWMYIVHLPLVLALNILLLPLDLHAFIKFAMVCGIAFTLMLGSYHLFVRYTLIGVMLNGTRVRREREERRALKPAAGN